MYLKNTLPETGRVFFYPGIIGVRLVSKTFQDLHSQLKINDFQEIYKKKPLILPNPHSFPPSIALPTL